MNLEEFGTNVKKATKEDIDKANIENTLSVNPCSKKDYNNENNFNCLQWLVVGLNLYASCGRTERKLPAGFYSCYIDNHERVVFSKKDIKIDELLKFPNSLSDQVYREVTNFLKLRDKFIKFGFLHRRGYLFYGQAGSGKSMIVQQIIKEIIDNNGIALSCYSYPETIDRALEILRKAEPDRFIVCVFEDIDATIEKYGEGKILAILDGENQIDNVLNLATTNYPEKLDKRIVSRPRRFDRVIKIDMPSDEIRRVYLNHKLNGDCKDIDKWVKNSQGFSFAQLSDLVISVECLGNNFEDTIKIFKDVNNKIPSSEDFEKSKPIGFV